MPDPTAPASHIEPGPITLDELALQVRAMLNEIVVGVLPETDRPFGDGLRRDSAPPTGAPEVLGGRWGRLAQRACADRGAPAAERPALPDELDAIADAVGERLVALDWTYGSTTRTTGSRGPGEARQNARDGAEAVVMIVRGATRYAVDVEVMSAPTLLLP